MALMDIPRIRLDGGTQHRVSLNEETVERYKDAYLDDKKLPPVELVHDGTAFWLWDGFHRIAGARRAGKRSINVNIERGTQRDAFIKSLGANEEHGLNRTLADRRNAVTAALQDDELSKLSERELARICNVSRTLVHSMKVPQESTVKVTASKEGTPSTPGADENSVDNSGGFKATPDKPEGSVATKRESHDADPGDVKVTKPGVKAIGSLQQITAERDAALDENASMKALLEEMSAQIVELEMAVEMNDVARALKEENKKLRELNRELQTRVNGLMAEKDEAVKSARRWKRKADSVVA